MSNQNNIFYSFYFFSLLCVKISFSTSLSISSPSLSDFSRLFLFVLVLEVEDLGVAGGGKGDEFGVKELEDFVADVGKLQLDPSQKASPKWVAIQVESGLRRQSGESGFLDLL